MSRTAPNRYAALAVLCAGTLMVIVDQTIVTVALPAIRRDLGFTATGLTWVMDAYVVPFGGLLLLAGRLGDTLGRRRLFVAGLALFTLASLGCGLAADPAALVAARFVQGVGAAAASAGLLGMLVGLFPKAGERARVLGVFSFVQAGGGALGGALGGILTQLVSWPWVFWVNVPVGALTVAGALRLLPPGRPARDGRRTDTTGGALVTLGLVLAVYAVVGVGEHAPAARTAVVAGAAAVLLAAFTVREATATAPLLPLATFRSRAVSGANAVLALLAAALFGFLLLLTLYLQRAQGYGALATGLGTLPVAAAIAVVSLGFSARLVDRFGAQAVLLGGLGLVAAGLALLGRAPVHVAYAVDVLPAGLLVGIGFGAAKPALMGLGMTGASDADAGLRSGLFNTAQQVGGALGLAVLATVAGHRTDVLAATGVPARTALTGGYATGFRLAAVLVAGAFVVAAIVLGRPHRTVRERDAAGRADTDDPGSGELSVSGVAPATPDTDNVSATR